MRTLKVAICIPVYGMTHAKFTQSLANMIVHSLGASFDGRLRLGSAAPQDDPSIRGCAATRRLLETNGSGGAGFGESLRAPTSLAIRRLDTRLHRSSVVT